MADEFTPEASVDFEALAAMAAAAETNGNGSFTPPADQPAQPPPARPRAATPRPSTSSQTAEQVDPFAALAKLVGDQELMFRELGAVNSKLAMLQLQTILMFGGALLLAVVVYKFARHD